MKVEIKIDKEVFVYETFNTPIGIVNITHTFYRKGSEEYFMIIPPNYIMTYEVLKKEYVGVLNQMQDNIIDEYLDFLYYELGKYGAQYQKAVDKLRKIISLI